VEGKRIILEPAPTPPDVFVDLGDSEKVWGNPERSAKTSAEFSGGYTAIPL